MTKKQALITGSSKRIGREMALCLAEDGYDLALHYNSSGSEVVAFAQELNSRFPSQIFFPVELDLRDWTKVHMIWDLLPDTFREISLLVNNASIYRPTSMVGCTVEELSDNFAIHLFSPYRLMATFASRFKKGLVINMVDASIAFNHSGFSPYLLSKKSLADLTSMAAWELAPHIRVNGIAPGPVLPAANDHQNRFEKVVGNTPLKQAVSINGILGTLRYFIQNTDVTGQIIHVDSGMHLGPKTS